ncbi:MULTISPECIES: AraC family transcriptional regulator [unclassified Paenibacillus]|uniref:AraC family transcriptional regulator n=1 Tax=unclassified Paenibacillus TaxID=185978 RepID=UPI003642D828
MNRLSINHFLHFKPYFYHYSKESIGPTQIFHAHQSMEIMFVHAGKGRVFLEGDIYDVEPGTLLIFHPFQLHRVIMDPLVPFTRTLILFDYSVLETYLHSFPQLRSFVRLFLDSQSAAHVIGPMKEYNILEELCRSFGQLQQEMDQQEIPPLSEKRIESFVLFIISFLNQLQIAYRELDISPVGQQGTVVLPHHVEKIMQAIEERFMDDLTIGELAQQLYLSMYHLSSLFRKTTGISFSTSLTNRRIREACLLLRTTTYPLKEIGNRVGMPNTSHFCTVFKKIMNITPIQYRNSQRE